MDTKIPAIVTSFSNPSPIEVPCSTPISAVHWIERTPARENHLFEGPAGGADPSTGGTDNPRRGEGPRRGRRQGGASTRLSSSSARSATTRRRARSRRRRSSARQRTGRPLRRSTQRNAAQSEMQRPDCDGGGLQHHHGQPNVKQGGAASSRSPTHSTPQFVVPFVEARLSEARGQVTATGALESECFEKHEWGPNSAT